MKNYPVYEVSNLGRLRSFSKRGAYSCGKRADSFRIRRCVNDRGECFSITLFNSKGGKRTIYVYVLVLEAFVGPRPKGLEACHKDDDRSNNRLSNLRWGTPWSNHVDALINGKRSRRYSDNEVRKIRERAGSRSDTQRQLAKEYGCTQSLIRAIYHRQSYRDVV